MARRLTLLRHAKSDWSDQSLRDFDRPLNKRGKRNAPAMGQLLKDRGISPDLIISSDANRAYTTARLVAQELGYPDENILLNHAMYLAAPGTLLEVLADSGKQHEHVMLVAHNPGMTELANRLSDASIDNLPTCGVFFVDADIENWHQVAGTQHRFAGFLCPRQDLD